MTILVTGGAGFIGRWVIKKLLYLKKSVVIIDNLSNGQKRNITEFEKNPNFKNFIVDDIKNRDIIKKLFDKYRFNCCIHLAAQINVEESLNHPQRAFETNLIGTFNILEESRKYKTKVIIIGTCMVYDLANSNKKISETHQLKPTSPYAGSKLAAEELALSYYYGFKLPVIILRPFNTYGPFQKTNMEGGVVSIFVKKKLSNNNIQVFGDGTQTRDFLYVEDCADFIVKATQVNECVGEVINAGMGKDISINDLAITIIGDKNRIEHIEHHHPQAEIMKLECDISKAKRLLNWEPKVSLEEGIKKLEKWIIEKEMI